MRIKKEMIEHMRDLVKLTCEKTLTELPETPDYNYGEGGGPGVEGGYWDFTDLDNGWVVQITVTQP